LQLYKYFLVWLLLPFFLSACSEQSTSPDVGMAAVKAGQVMVYECGDYDFVTYSEPGEVALYTSSDQRALPQVPAASGVKYTDDEVTFWSHGNEAMLDLGSRKYTQCQLNRRRIPWEVARRRGVDFRAVGQEPGWYLEMTHEQQLLFVAAYGGQRILLPTPEPVLKGERETYEVADNAHQLRVEISLQHCTDSMSGEAFDSSVQLTLDGKHYEGCGETLEHWWPSSM
jgi:putative lipoprotein